MYGLSERGFTERITNHPNLAEKHIVAVERARFGPPTTHDSWPGQGVEEALGGQQTTIARADASERREAQGDTKPTIRGRDAPSSMSSDRSKEFFMLQQKKV